MAAGTNVRTYFQGKWHDNNAYIIRAADHGAWLGSTVFDGARYAHGIAPDLRAHCERVVASANAFGMEPTQSAEEIQRIALEGLKLYPADASVYIRPMFWSIESGHMGIVARPAPTGFCICLEEIPLAPPNATLSLTRTRFQRPIIADALVNAKAGCLYPNNCRMLKEATDKGFDNALVADALGNVAETASSNVFMTKKGEVYTPIANGTFLAGVTRERVMRLLREAGTTVHECVLTFEDFREADEVFTTGNMSKVVSVTRFDDTHYQSGPVSKLARELYWRWAHDTCAPIR